MVCLNLDFLGKWIHKKTLDFQFEFEISVFKRSYLSKIHFPRQIRFLENISFRFSIWMRHILSWKPASAVLNFKKCFFFVSRFVCHDIQVPLFETFFRFYNFDSCKKGSNKRSQYRWRWAELLKCFKIRFKFQFLKMCFLDVLLSILTKNWTFGLLFDIGYHK